jgi:hypothetical protein
MSLRRQVLVINTNVCYVCVKESDPLGRGYVVGYEFVRRTPRYSLVLDIELTALGSEVKIRARTKMLSLYGCGVDTEKLLAKGTGVRIKLHHQGAEVNALARVIYSTTDLGMGVAFTSVEMEDQQVLACWIAEYLSIPIEAQ